VSRTKEWTGREYRPPTVEDGIGEVLLSSLGRVCDRVSLPEGGIKNFIRLIHMLQHATVEIQIDQP
jgi:hypothetical protein